MPLLQNPFLPIYIHPLETIQIIVENHSKKERMTGTLYYEWGHMEVKVNEAFEASKEYYDKLVSEYQWFMPNWLERIETNKKIVTEQGIYYYTKNKDNV